MMNFKSILLADAGLSVLLHALKALVALIVNWIVLHHFAVTDFVIWSVTSSVLIVATASDLGIGQYITTRMINSPVEDWPGHVSRGLSALVPMAVVSAVFVLFALGSEPLFYAAAMALILGSRLAALPYIAVLHATNRFKVRKAVELAAYLIAACSVALIALNGADVRLALLSLNATFLLGAVAMAWLAARCVPLDGSFRLASPRDCWAVYRHALPFMANNLAGLLTYGGFIWLCSLVLPLADMAKLAVLHTFILVNAYQFYDVFLKARQADLVDPAKLPPYRTLNLLILLTLPPSFLLFGREAVSLIDGRIVLDASVVALFGLLMALELGNLFAQAVTQVDMDLARRLNRYALIKAVSLLSFPLVAVLPFHLDHRLPWLLAMLSIGSLLALLYLIAPLGPHGRVGPVRASARQSG